MGLFIITSDGTNVVSKLSISDGQNQIAIRSNYDLNRIDDSIQTLHDSLQNVWRFYSNDTLFRQKSHILHVMIFEFTFSKSFLVLFVQNRKYRILWISPGSRNIYI